MTSLPIALENTLKQILAGISDPGPVMQIKSVGGGCINHASQVVTERNRYFLKWNPQPHPNMFTTEAQGLQMLAAVDTIRVPSVIKFQEAEQNLPAFILLEWIEHSTSFDQKLCGQQLAQLHLNSQSDQFGLDHNNYIGSTPQYNIWVSDWVAFFRDFRLQPQINLAQSNEYLSRSRQQNLERILSRLGNWLQGVPRKPALLHGDLWGGNVIADENGYPVLIDPAVYYGDREADLAFTHMFGGFSNDFYQAYNDVYTLEPGYQERFEIYNIYHILNHLNLFGESYGYSLDSVLNRLVG
ncbi:MAG: fructosamine kinase family protein [Anaerolineaceae bacterium]|nr:fructosamine kinase family protein [Anaerolineaceae bacterium]